MKNLSRFVAVCLGLLLGLSVLSANAGPQHGPDPLPSSIFTSYKFWPYATANLCVAVGDTVMPIGVAAQAWNNASTGVALNAENNCVTAGYTPSTRMTLDSYSAADGDCVKITNGSYAAGDTYRRWTNNPVGWVNRYYEGCWGTANLRAKWTSQVIGQLLGMRSLIGSTWDSRVMSRTSAVIYASASTDGPALTKLYRPDYFGWY